MVLCCAFDVHPLGTESVVPTEGKTFKVLPYEFIDCEDMTVPSEKVYNMAVKGFKQLREDGKLSPENNKLTIIDYSKSGNEKRLWVIDMDCGDVLFHELVSHGKKTGEEFASEFSNEEGSHMSSLGFFVTGEIYDGRHEKSLKLHGQEWGWNSNAFDRGVVIHGADYVSEQFIKDNGRLGRSLGCPAVTQEVNWDLINTIANGTCVFIYYPQRGYLKNSKFLR